jgi:hypothetical protein
MKYLNCIICCAIMFVLISCEKDEEELILPEMTSSGLNTFGCYIDENLFVYTKKSGLLWDSPINGYYDEEANILSIYSYAKSYEKNDLSLSVIDSIVEVGKKYEVSEAEYVNHATKTSYYICKDQPSEICILYFDKEKKIVSGTFCFKAINPKNNHIITISEGRFDIKMTLL